MRIALNEIDPQSPPCTRSRPPRKWRGAGSPPSTPAPSSQASRSTCRRYRNALHHWSSARHFNKSARHWISSVLYLVYNLDNRQCMGVLGIAQRTVCFPHHPCAGASQRNHYADDRLCGCYVRLQPVVALSSHQLLHHVANDFFAHCAGRKSYRIECHASNCHCHRAANGEYAGGVRDIVSDAGGARVLRCAAVSGAAEPKAETEPIMRETLRQINESDGEQPTIRKSAVGLLPPLMGANVETELRAENDRLEPASGKPLPTRFPAPLAGTKPPHGGHAHRKRA